MTTESKPYVYGRCASVDDLKEVSWNYNWVADGIYQLAQETGIFDETNCVIKGWRVMDARDELWDPDTTLLRVDMWDHANSVPVQVTFPAQFLFMKPEDVKAVWAVYMNRVDERLRARIRESKRKQYEELKKLFEPEDTDDKANGTT